MKTQVAPVTVAPALDIAAAALEPPAAPEAEATLLGAVMLLPVDDAANALAGIVEDDFTLGAHRLTFLAVRALLERNEQPTALAVLSELRRAGRVSSWPSASGSVGVSLHALVEAVAVPLGYGQARRAVLEAAARRRMHQAAVRLMQAAGSGPYDGLPRLVTDELRAALLTHLRLPLPAPADAPEDLTQ